VPVCVCNEKYITGIKMLLCVPIIAKDTNEALERIAEAETQADIMELRLDLMASVDLRTIIRSALKPIIVTYRSEEEGGMGKADSSVVVDYMTTAVEEGAEYIDVELRMPNASRERILKNRGNTRAIISTHINDNTPSKKDLERIYRESKETGADVIKIVTMATRWDDNFRLLETVKMAREEDVRIIAFCMGAMGRISRIFSVLMGGFLTFTSLRTGQESAPGQIPIDEMKMMLEYFSV
jgi:3-dehydroquinate dehydratase type I